MPVYNAFGFTSSDLEQVGEALENCLSIRFVPHESSFCGDYYLYETPEGNERLPLESNVDLEEGGPQYLEFSEFPIVLFESKVDRHDELVMLLEGAIAGCKLIKHKPLP